MSFATTADCTCSASGRWATDRSEAEGEWAVPACELESRSPHADTKIIAAIDTLLIFLAKEEFNILSSVDVWKVVIDHFRAQAADRPQTPFRARHELI